MDIIEKAKSYYYDEISSSMLYKYLSRTDINPEAKKLFDDLSEIETGHAKFWYKFLTDRNVKIKYKYSKIKFATVRVIRKLMSDKLFITLLEMKESTATEAYYEFLGSQDLTDDEKSKLSQIINDELNHEGIFHNREKSKSAKNIRDFVLGMNDGLVEILGAVTGLTAVYPHNPLVVGLNGLIVGISGALSMGIGNFISVRSQRQVNEGTSKKMKLLYSVSKDKARKELLDKFTESGLSNDLSKKIVNAISDNEEAMSSLLIEETDENEVRSGLYTGFAYIVGIVFPVLPYFITGSSLIALILSVVFAGLALAVVAAVVSIASNNPSIKRRVVEMVVASMSAALISYIFGFLVQHFLGVKS